MKLSFSKFGQNAKIKKEMVEAMEQAMEKFNQVRSFESGETITVIWNERMRSCGGKANGKERVIKLNARLLSENPEELLPTFLHELAHIVDYLMHGKSSGHKMPWKRIMRDMGEPVEVYHNMATKHLKAKRRKFEAKCNCKTHLIGVRRVNNIAKGASYSCRGCRGKLVVGNEVFDYE